LFNKFINARTVHEIKPLKRTGNQAHELGTSKVKISSSKNKSNQNDSNY